VRANEDLVPKTTVGFVTVILILTDPEDKDNLQSLQYLAVRLWTQLLPPPYLYSLQRRPSGIKVLSSTEIASPASPDT
jgi:hypothetical protein